MIDHIAIIKPIKKDTKNTINTVNLENCISSLISCKFAPAPFNKSYLYLVLCL